MASSQPDNSTSTEPPEIEGWTFEDLNEVLYKWDKGASPVIEYRYYDQSTKQEDALNPTDKTPADESKDVDASVKSSLLNISISGDDVHIFEFYAPWCPHCQNFKPTYIQIAKEVTRRSINVNVFFHAVSCTLNSDICSAYNIPGYPTFLGYRGRPEGDDDEFNDLQANTNVRGTQLSLSHNLNESIDSISSTLKFDISGIERKYLKPESKYSNSEDQRNYMQRKIERGREVAEEKIAFLEYDVSINDIYHDAILSLAYILRNGIYYQSNEQLDDGTQKSALNDFLKLVDWSTPRSWGVRKTFVNMMVTNFDTVVTQGKGRLSDFVDRETTNAMNHQNGLPWGYIDSNDEKLIPTMEKHRQGLGQDSPLHVHHHDEMKPLNPKKWTKNCNHGPSSSGFTCGLWELFHIISIGSGLTDNQIYGYQQGYIISQHEVAETLRNFIGTFFRCDVCRTNFLNMYENCGHDHCTRLTKDLSLRLNDGHEDVALWLWEVHNAVNVRLLREKAERERRNFTKTEELAAKFPTRKSCPSCWLDSDMSQWDSTEVYNFLQGRYWPYDKSLRMSSKAMHGNMTMKGQPLSNFGLFCIIMPFAVLGCMIMKKTILKKIIQLVSSQKNKSF